MSHWMGSDEINLDLKMMTEPLLPPPNESPVDVPVISSDKADGTLTLTVLSPLLKFNG